VDEYLEVAKRFLAWCVERGELPENPLASLKKIRNPQRSRHRRALTEDQLRRLLEVAPERAILYKTAILTGLRKDELRRLEWRDVRLDQTKPEIRLRPEANKARRDDRVPLHPTVAETLRSLRPEAFDPLGAVFATIPRPNTFRIDLRRAGIPYRDAEGKYADFHSLRYSYCTFLAKAAVPLRTAMELMRHKDPRLTIQIYTDAGQLELDEAVSRLPDL
jgi:integrase